MFKSMNCQSLCSKFDDIKLLRNRFEQYQKPIQLGLRLRKSVSIPNTGQ